MRASKRRGRGTGDRKIPRGSRVPGDPSTDSAIVQAYRPRDDHGRAARRGPHVHPLPPRGAIPTGELAKRREWSFGSHTLVFWLSPVQHLLMTVCPYELGIPAKIVTNTRTESAFPRTSHAPLTLQSSTMSAFVQSAFTTGGSTFVRARAQTRRAPTARVRPRISVANAHSNSRSDNTNRPYLLSSLQASGRVSLRVQAIAEGRQSLFVTVNVKPGKMEEYESLIKSHSESTKPHRSIHLPPDAHLPNRSHELLHERQVHVL